MKCRARRRRRTTSLDARVDVPRDWQDRCPALLMMRWLLCCQDVLSRCVVDAVLLDYRCVVDCDAAVADVWRFSDGDSRSMRWSCLLPLFRLRLPRLFPLLPLSLHLWSVQKGRTDKDDAQTRAGYINVCSICRSVQLTRVLCASAPPHMLPLVLNFRACSSSCFVTNHRHSSLSRRLSRRGTPHSWSDLGPDSPEWSHNETNHLLSVCGVPLAMPDELPDTGLERTRLLIRSHLERNGVQDGLSTVSANE